MDENWKNKLKGKEIAPGIMVIDRTELPEGSCQLCGAEGEELRPYGANGEWICFDCGQKDKKTTEERMANLLFGDPLNKGKQ